MIRESWNENSTEQIAGSIIFCGFANSIDRSEEDKIFCFKPGRGLNHGLSFLRSSEFEESRNENFSDCDEKLMAIDNDDIS